VGDDSAGWSGKLSLYEIQGWLRVDLVNQDTPVPDLTRGYIARKSPRNIGITTFHRQAVSSLFFQRDRFLDHTVSGFIGRRVANPPRFLSETLKARVQLGRSFQRGLHTRKDVAAHSLRIEHEERVGDHRNRKGRKREVRERRRMLFPVG
jgi:hypothetical protein